MYEQLQMRNANTLERAVTRFTALIQSLEARIRSGYLPMSLQQLAEPRLFATQNIRPWTPSYSMGFRYSVGTDIFRQMFGTLPVSPYLTPTEVAQETAVRRSLGGPIFATYAGAGAMSLGLFLTAGFLPALLFDMIAMPLIRAGISRLLSTRQIGLIRRALSSTFTHPEQIGFTGPTFYEATRIYHDVLRTATEDPLLGSREMMDVFARLSQTNLLMGVRNVEQFRRRFRELTRAVREIAQNLHVTFEDAINLMQEMQQLGIGDPRLMTRYSTLIRRASVAAGVAPQYGAGLAMGVASSMQQMGYAPEAGMMVGATVVAFPRVIENILGAERVRRLGGQEAVIGYTQQLAQGMLSNEQATLALLGMMDVRQENGRLVGRLNEDVFRRFQRGEITLQDLYTRASTILGQFPQLALPGVRANVLSGILSTPQGMSALFGVIPLLAQAFFPTLGPSQATTAFLTNFLPAYVAEEYSQALSMPMEVGRTMQETMVTAEIERQQNRQLEAYQGVFKRLFGRLGYYLLSPFRWLRETIYRQAEQTQLAKGTAPGTVTVQQLTSFYTELTNRMRADAVRIRDLAGRMPEELRDIFEESLKDLGDAQKELFVLADEAIKKWKQTYLENLRSGKSRIESAKAATRSLVQSETVAGSVEELIQLQLTTQTSEELRKYAYNVPASESIAEYESVWRSFRENPTFDRVKEIAQKYFNASPEDVLLYLMHPSLANLEELSPEARKLLAAATPEDVSALLKVVGMGMLSWFEKTKPNWTLPGLAQQRAERQQTLERRLRQLQQKLPEEHPLTELIARGVDKAVPAIMEQLSAAREFILSRYPELSQMLASASEKERKQLQERIDSLAAYLLTTFAGGPEQWAEALAVVPNVEQAFELAEGYEGIAEVLKKLQKEYKNYFVTSLQYVGASQQMFKKIDMPTLLEGLLQGNMAPESTRTQWKTFAGLINKQFGALEALEQAVRAETPEERQQAFFGLLRLLGVEDQQAAQSLYGMVTMLRALYGYTSEEEALAKLVPTGKPGQFRFEGTLTPEEAKQIYGTANLQQLLQDIGVGALTYSFITEGSPLAQFFSKLSGLTKEGHVDVIKSIFSKETPKPTLEVGAEESTQEPVSATVPATITFEVPPQFTVASDTIAKAAEKMYNAASLIRENIDLLVKTAKEVRSDSPTAK